MNIAQIAAKELLKIKAVLLDTDKPFTWSSGIKSPIYCDNRLILSHPSTRDKIESSLTDLIKKHYPQVQIIAGTSTAGIAHAAYVSKLLNLPMVYVRSKAKNHGTSKLIEGETKPKQKIVVIEDLLSTGQSCLQVVNTLRKAKLQVLGVVAIFSYNMDICIKNFKINNCSYHTLTNLDVLSQVAIKNKYINLKQQKRILNFRDCPKGKW